MTFRSQAAADPNVAFVGEDVEMRLLDDTEVAIETGAFPIGRYADPMYSRQCWAPDSRTQPGEYAWLYGTSMACPNAAGVAALIVSQHGDFSPYRARRPHLPPDVVKRYLLGTATRLGDPHFYGAGMVDALAAVNLGRMARTASPPSAR